MTTILSQPSRSRWSKFVHDLVTVDFHQTDIKTGLRYTTILVIITLAGVIIGYAAETGLVLLGIAYVLIIDQHRSKGPRTRVLLMVSILYASIFACGVVISISDNLVVPLSPWSIHLIIFNNISTSAQSLLLCNRGVCRCNCDSVRGYNSYSNSSRPGILAIFCGWTVGNCRW